MKNVTKILISVLLALGITSNSYADTCAKNLVGTFTPAQAVKLCSTFTGSSTISASLIPGSDNAYDLGSTSFSMRTLYVGTSVIAKTSSILRVRQDAQRLFTWDAASDTVFSQTFGDGGVTAAQTYYLGASTSDADDDSVTFITGGGGQTADGTRGATLALHGNEATGTGRADLVLGATANFRVIGNSGAEVPLTVSGASGGRVSVTGIGFPTANYESVAGAGTTVADAAALSATANVHRLTGANGTVGWKFATSVAGQFEMLLNTTAGVPKVYAASGGTCNGGAADAACTLVTGIVAHLCYSTAANTWICS